MPVTRTRKGAADTGAFSGEDELGAADDLRAAALAATRHDGDFDLAVHQSLAVAAGVGDAHRNL